MNRWPPPQPFTSADYNGGSHQTEEETGKIYIDALFPHEYNTSQLSVQCSNVFEGRYMKRAGGESGACGPGVEIRFVAALVAVVLLSWSGTGYAQDEPPWPMFHHDAQRTGKSQFTGPSESLLKWSYRVQSNIRSSPVVDSDGAIYIGTDDGTLYGQYENIFYRIDSIGSLSWSYFMRERIYSSAACSADKVYIGDFDHRLYCFFSTGTVSWSYLTGGDVDYGSSAVVNDNAVWIGIDDGRLYCFQHDGQLLWSYRVNDWEHLHSSPALGTTDSAYIGSSDNNLYCIDSLGAFIWSYETGDEIMASPSVSTDTVYVGSYDHFIYNINSIGALRWSYETVGNIEYGMAAAISTDSVWIGSEDTYLYSLTTSGQLSWSYRCASVHSSPALNATDTVYVGSNDTRVYSIDSGGSLIWSYDTGSAIYSSLAISTDTVYFGSYDNILYALTNPTPTPTQTPLPRTPTPICPQGLRVWLNKSSFNPGETLELGVGFSDTYMDWDGYLVFVRSSRTWSVVRGQLKRGVHPVVTNRLEIHNCWERDKVFSIWVPHNAAGQYTLFAAILPKGTRPTYANAKYGAYCQLASATFGIPIE